MDEWLTKIGIKKETAIPIAALAIGAGVLAYLLWPRQSQSDPALKVNYTDDRTGEPIYWNRGEGHPNSRYVIYTTKGSDRVSVPCDCSHERRCGCTGGDILFPTQQKLVEDMGLLIEENARRYFDEILSAVPAWMQVQVSNPLEGMQNYGPN